MARDCIELMHALGHDRGSYVAFRLAMDHPGAVTRLVVLDSVPIGEALARCDASFAAAWWHWFFLGNPAADAERVITADPDAWYRVHGKQEHMGRESWTDLTETIRDPATVHAMCEDYRAGLTVDRAHDDADKRAGRRVTCPTLGGWSIRDGSPRAVRTHREVRHPPTTRARRAKMAPWLRIVKGFGSGTADASPACIPARGSHPRPRWSVTCRSARAPA